MTSGFGSIWVVAQDSGLLVQIDPSPPVHVVQWIDIGKGARLAAVGPAAVYVAQFGQDRVLAVDPDTGDVTRSAPLCSGPQGLAVDAGRVWVACPVTKSEAVMTRFLR